MKYCPNCGTGLDDAAVFCTACGVQQAPAAPVAPVEAPVEAPVYAEPEVVPTAAYVGEPQAPVYAPAPNYAPNYAPVYPTNYAPAPTASVGAKVSAGVGFGLDVATVGTGALMVIAIDARPVAPVVVLHRLAATNGTGAGVLGSAGSGPIGQVVCAP